MLRPTLPLALGLVLLATTARADVRLAGIFGDHMVLQRDDRVAIWGWADPGAEVRVRGTWSDENECITTAAADGSWRVTLPTAGAGGPFSLVVRGTNRIELADVLLGEVWICSGQSNMQWPVAWCADAEAEIAAADHPRLRLFTVARTFALRPARDVGGSWQPSAPDTTADFSATAYYFGRALLRELDVPIGLVSTNWGGTVVESWTSHATLERFEELAPALARLDQALASKEGMPDVAQAQGEWWRALEERDPGMTGRWMDASVEDATWRAATLPGRFEDVDLGAFDGCVWFRRSVDVGEAWAGRDLVLELGPVDDMDLTWFNGTLVGETREDGRWDAPRSYRVPGELVRSGANVVSVCAVDAGGLGSVGMAGDERFAMRLCLDGSEDEEDAVSLAGAWRARAGASTAELGAFPRRSWFHENYPTALHNGMIAPLVPFAVRGAIWYQGESNRERAAQYRRLFPALIADWRALWGRELSFDFVQIAPFGYGGDVGQAAELREAQALALAVPGTGMAVTMDVGDPADIHPKDKQTVGERLALIALARDYGRDVVFSGPLPGAMVVVGDEARITFTHADGLTSGDGPPSCFTIAGEDRVFHTAEARIAGDAVVVRSDAVARPRAVRYAWGAADQPNLKNGAGLPAPSFRTDTWPLVTAGR